MNTTLFRIGTKYRKRHGKTTSSRNQTEGAATSLQIVPAHPLRVASHLPLLRSRIFKSGALFYPFPINGLESYVDIWLRFLIS